LCHFQTHAPQQRISHSITSSARAASAEGMAKPSDFAVPALITISIEGGRLLIQRFELLYAIVPQDP
jgi:hypothetical protein